MSSRPIGNHHISIAILASCFALTLAGIAIAETPNEAFVRLDVTNSGYLSGTEAEGLSEFDTNGDKRLTQEEYLSGRLKNPNVRAAAERVRIAGSSEKGEGKIATGPATAKTSLKNEVATVVPATEVSGEHGVEGLFLQVKTSYGMNGSLNFNQEHYYFSKDGRVYNGIPEEGLDDFTFETACAKHPKKCGRYGITGDQITLSWPGREEKIKFERKGDDLELNGLFASKVGSMKPGQTLDGSYGTGGTAGGGGTFVSNARSLKFNPDGTFETNSVGGVSIDSSSVSDGASSQSQGRGTYRIGKNTMELKHADGKVTKHTIYPFDMGDGRVDISVDGSTMKKEN